MEKWRDDGPIGVLLDIINYIKTPQQYALFEKYQRLAQADLPANATATVVNNQVNPTPRLRYLTRWGRS
jgi:hypothetical protein